MGEKLFADNITPSDELYRVIRDEGRCAGLKSYTEKLWGIYHCYADKDFPKQLSQDFHARFWEMYLTCTLVHNGLNVVPKRMKAKGPDIKVDNASITIWIEAVTPTSGDPSKPDSVPSPRTGVAQEVPDEKITLRYCSAIRDKYFDQYFKYIDDGIISIEDCYVIALNGCRIPWPGGDYEPPRIVRSILPFGWQVVTIDKISGEVVDRGYQYRACLRKASDAKVDTDIFVKKEYSHISAILFSKVDVANCTPTMGGDFIIVHNPLAESKLPEEFLKVGHEYKAQLSGDTINLFAKHLR